MIRKVSLLCLLLFVGGCTYFDPLHLMPKPSVVIVPDSWEEKAPDKAAYKTVYEIWLKHEDKAAAAEYAKQYHALFDGLAEEVKGNAKIQKAKQLFDLLDVCREAVGIPAGVDSDFSNYSASLLVKAGLGKGGNVLDDEVRTATVDAMKSISCGCAAAYNKLHRGGK